MITKLSVPFVCLAGAFDLQNPSRFDQRRRRVSLWCTAVVALHAPSPWRRFC